MGDQTDNAFEIPAAGMVLNKVTGVFAGTGNPWTDTPDAPIGSLFLRSDGSDYKRVANTGSGVQEDWVFRSAYTGEEGGVSLAGTWRFDTSTSMTAPASSRFRYDNATPASVTQLAFDDTSREGGDFSNVFNHMNAGDRLFIQQTDTAANFIFVELTENPTDNTGWFLFDIKVLDSGTLPTNNRDCVVLLINRAQSDFKLDKQFGFISAEQAAGDSVHGSGMFGAPLVVADAEVFTSTADGFRLALISGGGGKNGNEAQVISGDIDALRLDQLPRLFFKFDVGLTTSLRVFVGLSVAGVDPAADNAVGSSFALGLVYSSDRPDTNWQFVVHDGTTQVLVDSGIAVDTLVHGLEIRVNSTTDADVTLFDAAGDPQATTKFTTELMAGTDDMVAGEYMFDLEAVRTLGFFHINAELEGP